MNGADGHFNLIMLQRNMVFSHGIKLMCEGDYVGAQQIFKTILQKISDLQAKFHLARCYQLCKDYDSAILTYEEVFQKNQKDPRPVYQQGVIYDIKNQPDIALKQYEKAGNILTKYISEINDDPKLSIIFYTLGCKYEQRNEIEKAKKAFTQFIECSNISEKDKKKGNKRLLALSIPLDVSETQQFKSKYHQEARQQSFIKPKQIDELNKSNIIRQQENTGSQYPYMIEVKEDIYQKKDVRKAGDSNISSQQSTAEKHPSIRPSINLISAPLDDYSLNQKINNLQQQDYKFITSNNQPQNSNNQSSSNQHHQQQINSPPQKSESTIKLNSNYQKSNNSHIYEQKQNQNLSQLQQFDQYQIQRDRITFDQTSPKDIWAQQNNHENETEINVKDKYQEVNHSKKQIN